MGKFEDTLTDNEWETGSGLPLADIDAEIIAAQFGFNSELGADRICMNFEFVPLEGGETIKQSFTVGTGWEAIDKGDKLVPDNGRPRKINSSSTFGRIIDSVVAVCQEADIELPIASPRVASSWVGTRWHVGTVEIDTIDKDKKPKKGNAYIFTAYLGRDEAAASTPAKSSAKATTSGKPAAGKGGGDIDPELKAKLIELAGEYDDFDAFTEAALALEGVDGVRAVEKLVLKSGDGGIWAEAKS